MRSTFARLRLAVAAVMLVGTFAALASTNVSVWVYPSPGGRLISQPDAFGNRILDYSGIGYQGGKLPLPSSNTVPVKIVVTPVVGDNVANIQAAINYVSGLTPDTNGFRGAVFLSNGTYNVGSQIKISTSGVVLRGAGSSTNGTGTLLFGTSTNNDPPALIEVTGSGSASTVSGTTHNITNSYLPVGARSFYVDSTSGLSVGQNVYVERIATSNWIHDLGMDLLGPPPDVPWTPGGYNLNMERTITRIEGNHIFIDAPITCAIDAVRYTNGTIRAFTWTSRITNCAVEHIFGQSYYGGNTTNENHEWTFVQFDRVVNGWVRDVNSQYFAYSCVYVNSGNKFVTVQDCQSLDPISIITGGRRYAFNLNDSQDCLFKNCYTRQDRHQFVAESVTIGPSAFVDGLSDSAHAEAGPHQRWATAILWDNITVHGGNNDIQNAGNYGTGHGWEGANCLIWNNAANGFIVQNPPYANNWLIGSIGPIQNGTAWNIGNTNMPHAPGNYDSTGSTNAGGTNVFPSSLYFAQLQDRLAAPNLQTRDYWLGAIDAFTNIARDVVTLDSAWSNTVRGVASGQPLDPFNVVTNNHWIPFTFNFSIGSTERVVAATISVALRATNSAAGDVLYLGSTSNSFTFSSLGWLPVTTSLTNSTVRVLDLASQLNLLTNGQLNVAISGDAGVDWAMLELQVAPAISPGTTMLLPVADATVRGGASANSNFGTATTLTVKNDSVADNQRQAYLRWDLTGMTQTIFQARIRLMPVSVGTNGIEQGVRVANSNNWSETAVTWNNQPGAGERFATWIPGTNAPVSFDVTPQVLDALAGDKQLTVQLFSVHNLGAADTADYGSRENADPNSRPQLVLSTLGSPPVISDITNRTIPVNGSTGPIAFTVGDQDSDATNLVVSGASSNTNLVPNANIVFGGSGSNRTVTVTPAANQSGLAVITVTVTDSGGLSSSDAFTLTVSSHTPGIFVWNGTNGATADTNWSSGGNWLPGGPPEALDDVKFFDNGNAAAVSNINNVIDASFGGSIASLQYGNTNGSHTTLIPAGRILNLSGANGLVTGTETDNGSSQTVFATVTGAGALVVNNAGANLVVRQGNASGGSQRATLDLSGLNEFDAAINQISVGVVGPVNRATGTLLLARTNDITATGSPGLLAGDSGSNGGGLNFIYLGQNNSIFADNIVIGRQKATATLKFNSGFANSSAIFRASDGQSAVSSWSIGDGSLQSSSSSSSIGTNDFTGGSVDALVDTLAVGKSQKTTGASCLGVLTFNSGTINVNTLQVGVQSQSGATNGGIGYVNVNSSSATLVVNTVLALGQTAGGVGTSNTVGALNVNGGTIFANAVTAGALSGSNSIALNGAVFTLTNTAGTLASPITIFNSTNSAFSLNVGATNFAVINLTTGGTNAVNIATLPAIGLVPAQFALIKYSGAIGGAGFNFSLGSLPAGIIAGGYLSNNTANSSVDLVITNYLVPDAFLTWDGSINADWNTDTANWKNNVGPGLTYSDGQSVLFNDSASGPTDVNLTDTFAPDGVTVSNNVKSYIFDDSGSLTGAAALTKQGSGTLTIANSGSNDFTGGVTIGGGTLVVGDGSVNGNLPAAGTVTDNAALIFNRTDNIVVPNIISGSGTVSQSGGGILTLSGANTFTGRVTIANGTVLAGNASALGTANGNTVITNSGTLDVSGLNLTAEPFVISGAGVSSNGAVVNSGAQQISALRQVTLAGDVTFGGANRWDIRNTGGTANLSTSPAGSAYKITKVGPNQVSLVAVTVIDAALGDIDIQQGTFAIQTSTTQVGDPNKTITVHSNAVLDIWALTAGPLNKKIVLQDGATIFNESGTSTNAGTVTLQGNDTFNIGGTSLKFTNVLSGSGGLIKTGSGALYLSASNTYSGSTLINVGTLFLTNAGSITTSTNVTIAAGATLDATGRSDVTLTMASGQTLSGAGAVTGGLTVNAGATISPGTNGLGLLTVSGATILRGVARMELNRTASTNDVLQVNASLNYGGTLALTNLSGTLAVNDSFKLFNATSYNGAFTNITPVVPRPGLIWDTNLLAVSGTLRIAAAPQPSFTSVTPAGANLILAGSNVVANEPYWLLASTNVTLPRTNWTAIATNLFDGNGAFNLTNPIDPSAPRSFYLLQLQ